MYYDRLHRDSTCSAADKKRRRENAGNAIFPGGNGVDGHGGYTYSSSYTKNKCEPPQPRAPTSRTLLNRHAGSTLESYPPAALLLMNPSAHHKQSAKGVLSMGSGAHDRQRSGAIPAQPSQTDLIVVCKIAPFCGFYL